MVAEFTDPADHAADAHPNDHEHQKLWNAISDLEANVGKDIEALLKRIDGLKSECSTMQTSITALTARVGQAESSIAPLTKRVGQAEADIAQIEADLKTTDGAVQQIKAVDLRDLSNADGRFAIDLTNTQRAITDAYTLADVTLDTRIASQQNDIAGLERVIGLRTDVDELLRSANAIEDLDDLETSLTNARVLLANANIEISEKQAAALTGYWSAARRFIAEYRGVNAAKRRTNAANLLNTASREVLSARSRSHA